jgi:hypothetical protein
MNIQVPTVTSRDLTQWQKPFAEVLDIVRRRTRDAWVPTWRSDAAEETTITSRLLRDDGSPWGTSPTETVFTAAAVLIDAVLESAKAVHLLLNESPTSTLVIETVTRATLEAACQARDLLEPGIGPRARVARLYVLRRCSAKRLEDTARRMNVVLTPGHGPGPADIDRLYRDQLGLVEDLSRKGNWIGCEGQKPFSYTERAAAFLRDVGQSPGEGPYAFYCGASHAELWRILYSYESGRASDGAELLVPRASRDFLRAAVSVCVDAVVWPAVRAFLLLGRGAALAQLRSMRQPMRNALKS